MSLIRSISYKLLACSLALPLLVSCHRTSHEEPDPICRSSPPEDGAKYKAWKERVDRICGKAR